MIRSFVRTWVVNDVLWSLFGHVFHRSNYLRVQRNQRVESRFEAAIEHTFANASVMAGPFAGLRYPANESRGSALWPKLVGSYEKELHHLIETLCGKSYDLVADWGCAEGYYLIGLGRRLPNAFLLAVDPDPRARELCALMAELNAIESSRINVRASATLDDVAPLLGSRNLIICDCEGYEVELFDHDLSALVHTDVLVECHDHLVPDATARLSRLFAQTHRVTSIRSEPRSREDLRADVRANLSRNFSSEQLTRIMDEGRPTTMTWLLIESLD